MSFEMESVGRHISVMMPVKRHRELGDIPAGSAIALNGYGLVFDGFRLGATSTDGNGRAVIKIDVAPLPDGAVVPRFPGLDGDMTLTTGWRMPGSPAVAPVALDQVLKARVQPVNHPLDYCVINPGWHYPVCCGRLWPCQDAMATIGEARDADRAAVRARSCQGCGGYIYGGHVQFGDRVPGKADPVAPGEEEPEWTPLRLVADGEPAPVVGDRPAVRFCRRSKCVTAARRFGEANGCEIPGTRRQLEADLRQGVVKVPWPTVGRPAVHQPSLDGVRPVLEVVR